MLWATRDAVNADLSIVPHPSRQPTLIGRSIVSSTVRDQPDAARLDFATVAAYEDDYFP
jgi:hypothetical protein